MMNQLYLPEGPTPSQSPEEVTSQSVLVTYGPTGSVVSQDTGRDAQVYANGLGIPVIALDSPNHIPTRKVRNQSDADYSLELQKQIPDIQMILGRLAVENPKLILAGRSAAAFNVLSLGTTGELNVAAIVALESPGFTEITVKDGHKKFAEIQKKQKDLVADESGFPNLVRPHGTGLNKWGNIKRAASIAVNYPLQAFSNEKRWASNAARKNAELIAQKYPGRELVIRFAGQCSLTDQVDIDRAILDLPQLRADAHPDHTQEVQVSQDPDTVHSSFDNRQHVIKILAPIVERHNS